MRLTPNEQTPEFRIADIWGESQSSEKYKGKKWMFSFYRYASCPLCNLRVNQLTQKYENWRKKDFYIVGVFESSIESIQQYVGKQDAPFPIIPNPDLSLYHTYHLDSSWVKFMRGGIPFMKAFAKGFLPGKMEDDKSIIPADFLINDDGTIHTAFYGNHIGDHLPIEKINRFLNGRL
jgi:peroxiredoxin